MTMITAFHHFPVYTQERVRLALSCVRYDLLGDECMRDDRKTVRVMLIHIMFARQSVCSGEKKKKQWFAGSHHNIHFCFSVLLTSIV